MRKSIKLILIIAFLLMAVFIYGLNQSSKDSITPLTEFTESELLWMANNPVILVAIDPIFAPYEFYQDDEQIGLTIDYLNHIESNYPIEFDIVRYETWTDSLSAFKNKDVDMVSAVAQSPQRDKFMLFTEAYFTIQNVVLVRDNHNINFTDDELAEMHVAVIKDYFAQDLLELHYPGVKLYKSSDIEDGLRALSFGKVDAFVVDSAQAAYYIPKIGVNNLTMNDNIELGFDLKLRMGIRDDAPELRNILSKIIILIPEDVHSELREKWITNEFQPGVNKQLLFTLIVLLVVILVAAILVISWNTALNRQVSIKRKAIETEIDMSHTLELQLDSVINGIPYPVSMKNHHGVYLYVNQAYIDLIGIESPLIIGNSDNDIGQQVSSASQALSGTNRTLQSGDQDVIEKGNTIHLPAQKIKISNTKDKIFETTKMPFIIHNDEPHGVLSFSVDITDQLHSETELKELNDHLEEIVELRLTQFKLKNSELMHSHDLLKDSEQSLSDLNTKLTTSVEVLEKTQAKLIEVEKFAALGRAASGIAHAMNTPLGNGISASTYALSVVSLLSDELNADAPSGNMVKTHLSTIDKSLDLINTSISRMLDIAKSFERISKDEWGDESISFRLSNLIKDSYKLLDAPSGIQVDIVCDESLSLIGSPVAFDQIFTHLISNTISHGFVEYKQPQCIMIRCDRIENNLYIHYEDNGVGVDPSQLPSLSEPLFTTKRGSGHLGIGFSIIYNIVVRHYKGKLSIDNLPEGGLYIDIKIPHDQIEWND